MTAIIQAQNLQKHYGTQQVLRNIQLEIPAGRIVGVIGPNGAGKTTLLQALLGLRPVRGEMQVAGYNPVTERPKMLEDVCFIADTAILPGWIKVADLLRYTAAVHPHFNRTLAEGFLAKTKVRLDHKVKQLSKGMITQLHLALVMAIDAKVLVLDEPTLGLDILYRKTFYDNLLNNYYDGEKTIVITTHQVEEIEHILTDVIFIDNGDIVLNESVEDLQDKFFSVKVSTEQEAAAAALGPIAINRKLSGNEYLFESVAREQLAPLGELRLPSLADLFVAKLGNSREEGHE